MFAKGYTNIRAMIETQYGILSQMVTDIAYRYQTQLKGTEEEADRFARDNSDGDYDVYRSILNSFNDVEERQSCLMTESRKILFCAIFSYYETMLNEFVLYYKIANEKEKLEIVLQEKRNETNNLKNNVELSKKKDRNFRKTTNLLPT